MPEIGPDDAYEEIPMSNVRLSIVPQRDHEDHISATLGTLLSVARTLACLETLPARVRRRYTSILRRRTRSLLAKGSLRSSLANDDAPPPSGPRPSLLAPAPSSKVVQDVILETLMDEIHLEQHGVETLRRFLPQLDAIAALLDVAASRGGELDPQLADSSASDLMERTVRGCLASLQYRGVTVIASTDGGSAIIDSEMMERALRALLQHVIGTMPRGATIEITLTTAGDSLLLDLSFTGALVAPGAASLMSGLEIVYFRAACGAHGAAIEIDERSGRTSLHVDLPSHRAPLLRRCA